MTNPVYWTCSCKNLCAWGLQKCRKCGAEKTAAIYADRSTTVDTPSTTVDVREQAKKDLAKKSRRNIKKHEARKTTDTFYTSCMKGKSGGK